VTIEHDLPVALGDELEIIKHVHPAGSTDLFGEELSTALLQRSHMQSATRPKPSRACSLPDPPV